MGWSYAETLKSLKLRNKFKFGVLNQGLKGVKRVATLP
jgi:hypothetical protein